jgi:hypothetical protein
MKARLDRPRALRRHSGCFDGLDEVLEGVPFLENRSRLTSAALGGIELIRDDHGCELRMELLDEKGDSSRLVEQAARVEQDSTEIPVLGSSERRQDVGTSSFRHGEAAPREQEAHDLPISGIARSYKNFHVYHDRIVGQEWDPKRSDLAPGLDHRWGVAGRSARVRQLERGEGTP